MYEQQPTNTHICSLAYRKFFILIRHNLMTERAKMVEKGKCGEKKRRVKKEAAMGNKKERDQNKEALGMEKRGE